MAGQTKRGRYPVRDSRESGRAQPADAAMSLVKAMVHKGERSGSGASPATRGNNFVLNINTKALYGRIQDPPILQLVGQLARIPRLQ